MLNNSGDILNIILAISVATLTIFLCWAIYYFIASAQRIHSLVRKVESGVSKAEEILDIARNKLKNSRAYFIILGEIVKQAMEFVKEKQPKKSSAKKK